MDDSESEVPPLQGVDKVKDLDKAEFESGFQCCVEGQPFDGKRSAAWQLGWHSAEQHGTAPADPDN
jgi:hypothetical protein